MLFSEVNNRVEKALKYLLQHELWSEAVELVKNEASNVEKLPTYLHITTTALAQVRLEYFIQHFKTTSRLK